MGSYNSTGNGADDLQGGVGAACLTMAHHSVTLTACSPIGVHITNSAASLTMAESSWALDNGEVLKIRKARNYSKSPGSQSCGQRDLHEPMWEEGMVGWRHGHLGTGERHCLRLDVEIH